MKIKAADTVLVIAGKDRNKTGKILRVDKKNKKVVVEKLNLITKHIKKTKTRKGDKIRFEAPMEASNVMIICPHCSKPTRVQCKIENKIKARICKICKESVDQKIDSAAIKTNRRGSDSSVRAKKT